MGVTGFGVSQIPDTYGLSGVSVRSSNRVPCPDWHLGKPISAEFGTCPNFARHRCSENMPIYRDLRHRYGDSNPGFRTENPPWEVNLGRFRPDKGDLVQSGAVEIGGVGDIFRDTKFAFMCPLLPCRVMRRVMRHKRLS
jgi:hypothetical protein